MIDPDAPDIAVWLLILAILAFVGWAAWLSTEPERPAVSIPPAVYVVESLP